MTVSRRAFSWPPRIVRAARPLDASRAFAANSSIRSARSVPSMCIASIARAGRSLPARGRRGIPSSDRLGDALVGRLGDDEEAARGVRRAHQGLEPGAVDARRAPAVVVEDEAGP